jgi:hypothetical protein
MYTSGYKSRGYKTKEHRTPPSPTEDLLHIYNKHFKFENEKIAVHYNFRLCPTCECYIFRALHKMLLFLNSNYYKDGFS